MRKLTASGYMVLEVESAHSLSDLPAICRGLLELEISEIRRKICEA